MLSMRIKQHSLLQSPTEDIASFTACMVIERDDDSQVSVKITFASSQNKVSNYLRDDWARAGMITKEVPEHTLSPTILRIAYKRIWDAIEKQLFLQNIILNR